MCLSEQLKLRNTPSFEAFSYLVKPTVGFPNDFLGRGGEGGDFSCTPIDVSWILRLMFYILGWFIV